MHKKSAHFERFMINDDKSFNHWYANLLADAERAEYRLEDMVVGDAAGDFAEGVSGAADIFGKQLARNIVADSALGLVDMGQRVI